MAHRERPRSDIARSLLVASLTALCTSVAGTAQVSVHEQQRVTWSPEHGTITGFAVDGEWAITVGGWDANGGTGSRVHFYRHDGFAWRLDSEAAPGPGAAFGFLIDAEIREELAFAAESQGRVHTFQRQGDHWLYSGAIDVVGDVRDLERRGRRLFVAVDGGHAEGRVVVLRREGRSWTLEAELRASDGAAWQYFGQSIAAQNDRVVVGARDADGFVAQSGAVYVFGRDGHHWTEQAKLASKQGSARDRFGWSVALLGDQLAIGAPAEESAGVVHLYRQVGSAWKLERKLRPDDSPASFGEQVRLSDDALFVGDARDLLLPGRAQVFRDRGLGELDRDYSAAMPAVNGLGSRIAVSNERVLARRLLNNRFEGFNELIAFGPLQLDSSRAQPKIGDLVELSAGGGDPGAWLLLLATDHSGTEQPLLVERFDSAGTWMRSFRVPPALAGFEGHLLLRGRTSFGALGRSNGVSFRVR